ncbi:MAG TPA: hypothetical protein VNV85_03335 [Puia sp.]|jgi:hypothetical protein|nr:hypothetical protein [Puia sp.]
MKETIFFFLFMFFCIAGLRSQQLKKTDLEGTWDQNVKKNAATIIFVDTARVRFSYKGHSGSSRSYYYLLDNSKTPSVLTVDYRANHRRNRNVYLIQLIDKKTMKLQVILKKESRDHFDEADKNKMVILVKRDQ